MEPCGEMISAVTGTTVAAPTLGKAAVTSHLPSIDSVVHSCTPLSSSVTFQPGGSGVLPASALRCSVRPELSDPLHTGRVGALPAHDSAAFETLVKADWLPLKTNTPPGGGAQYTATALDVLSRLPPDTTATSYETGPPIVASVTWTRARPPARRIAVRVATNAEIEQRLWR